LNDPLIVREVETLDFQCHRKAVVARELHSGSMTTETRERDHCHHNCSRRLWVQLTAQDRC